MVEQVRAGVGMREVARAFRVSLSVVQRWVGRADGQRLDRVDWSSKTTSGTRPSNRTVPGVESLILTLREQLAKTSDLGEHGAEAIHVALLEHALENHRRSAPSAASSSEVESWMVSDEYGELLRRSGGICRR